MNIQFSVLRAFASAIAAAVLTFSTWAGADPPSRVARLGYTSGVVSFSPGGENDWVRATVNRPLTTGDRLWTDSRARAEIQVGGAVIRMNAYTGVSVLNLDDRITQLQLTQGTLNVRVRRLERNQAFEVDTPNLAFTLRQAGEYRIEVDPEGDATTIFIRKGAGEVYGESASYVIDSRQPYRFTGTGLREYEYIDAPRLDEFDRWAVDRDRRYDSSGSARYVSQDVVGYEDLDANGTWRADPTYGHIWFPNRMDAGWAPYRDGHWAWIDPWGWTWVDDAPWGYAVSHYGRWTNLRGNWGWVPGPVRSRAYYAPALVAFVGGDNFRLTISSGNVGGVAWFPLAPREVYRPSYTVSRGYFENINRSNTVVTTTVINNYYNNTNVTNVVYANQQVQGAVIAVPAAAFVQSQSVSKAAVQVSREMIVSAPVVIVPRVAPTEKSVRGAAAQGNGPPGRVFERPVVARTAPPAAHPGFAAQQQQLTAQPGKPLDAVARKELRPTPAVPAPVVNVIAPAQVAPPTTPPPRVAPAGKSGQMRGNASDSSAPATPAAPRTVPQAAPPVTAVRPQEPRGNAEQRGKGESRGQPVTLPAAPAAPSAVPQVAPPVTSVPPQEPRGNAEQRGKGESRVQPVTLPATPAAPSGAPRAVPQAAPPVTAVPPQEPRGNAEKRGKAESRGQPDAPQATPAPQTDQRGKSEQRGKAEPPRQAAPPLPAAAPVPAPVPQAAPPAPVVKPAEQGGKAEQRGKAEQARPPVAPPPVQSQRATEPKNVPPQAAPAAPATPPQPQRAKPEPVPAVKQAEPRPPVAASPPPPSQPAPKAAPPGQAPAPVAGDAKDKKKDKKKDGDEQDREEENRKQKK